MANNNSINDTSFFQRLTRLFRSGPALRRKIKGYDEKDYYDSSVKRAQFGYYGPGAFRRENSPFSMMGAYGIIDRVTRYATFEEMEYTPEVNCALDLYADESCSGDENGRCFHVFSDNPEIQKALEELFYETCNVDYDMRRWVRNLIKYGDFFLYTEVQPDVGVVNVEPIAVNAVIREENYDQDDPYAVRFKLTEQGGKYLENWQVCHLRILANDLFLPYGTSFLEGIRRVWNQLLMIEDAMLLYRFVRSPERRVFYIDVAAIHPNEVPNYMEQVKEQLRASSVVDKMNGRMDFRYNPISVDEDYFLPTRPNSQTKIESLAGGQHVSAIEDVEYIRSKLVAGLKVPKPYLGFDDNLASKASLAQVDIRFSRTITNIQKIVIAEMNKLAIIHLFAKGFEGEDLLDFELRLTNPSTMAVQQKLSLWSLKFEIASKAKETELVSEEWIQKEILELRMNDILKIREDKEKDALRAKAIEQLEPVKGPESSGIVDPFDPSNYELPGGPPANNAAYNQPADDARNPSKPVVLPSEEQGILKINVGGNQTPIKVNQTPYLDKRSGDEFIINPFKEDIENALRNSIKRTMIPEHIGNHMKSVLMRFYNQYKKDKQKIVDLEIINESTKDDSIDIFGILDNNEKDDS